MGSMFAERVSSVHGFEACVPISSLSAIPRWSDEDLFVAYATFSEWNPDEKVAVRPHLLSIL